MPDTSGRKCSGSLTSSVLQRCLESKLQAHLDVHGSLEYAMTWRRLAMPLGPSICQLVAWARHTSAKGCGESQPIRIVGWPTPLTNDSQDSDYAYGPKKEGEDRKKYLKLPGAANSSRQRCEESTADAGQEIGNSTICRQSSWLGNSDGSGRKGHEPVDSGQSEHEDGPDSDGPTTETGIQTPGMVYPPSERHQTREAPLGPCEPETPWARFEILCGIDGSQRRIEPGPQQMADGFSEVLGRLRSDAIQKIEKELKNASICEEDAREALRILWQRLSEEALQKRYGRLHRVYDAPILLNILRELKREGWHLLDHLPSACWETLQDGMRALSETTSKTSCTSQGRRREQQQSRELENIVSTLSQIITLISQDANMIPFPLAYKPFERVGRLKGYGNAIVPSLAAVFIRSFLEAEQELR